MKYVYRKHPSKMATLMVTFGAGSRAEFNSKYPAGMAHFMEHLRFKGSKNFTAKDLLRKMDFAGGDWNAFTAEDMVSYHITIPEENLETAFECMGDIINYPAFPQEEMEKEQEVVCQELRMYDDDIGYLVQSALVETVFNGSPLGSPIGGTEKSVRSITRQDLINFNNQFYSPEHQLITLCSAYDRIDLVEKYFSIPNDNLVWMPKVKASYCPPFEKKVEKESQLQNIVKIAYGGDKIEKLALEDSAKLDVFNCIFGSAGASRLFLRIREDLGLVYGIRSGVYDNMDGALFKIGTSTEPENIPELLMEIDGQIKLITDTLPTDEELTCAKNKIRSAEYSSMDTSIATAAQVLDEVFYNEVSTSQYLAEVNAVTANDVKDVAEKIFSENRYMVIGCDKK